MKTIRCRFLSAILAAGFVITCHAAPTDLDTSFSGDGKVTTIIGNRAIGYDVALQSDGKIVVAGEVSNDGGTTYAFGVARYLTGGSLDNSFGTSGSVTVTFGGHTRGRGVAVQTDGNIVVAGYTNSGGSNNDFALVRLTADGPPDTSFGTGGAVKTDFGRNFDFANCIALQADGKLVVAGSTDDGSGIHFAVVRYNTDGSLDGSFGSGGKVTTPIGSGNSSANEVLVQSDGKIVVVGEAIGSNKDFAVVRYNPNGSLDTSFGGGTGKFVASIRSNNDIAYGVAQQVDGKIVVVGETEGTTVGGTYDFALVRLNTNGTLDTSFSGDGKLTTQIDYHDKARSVAVRIDGKITVAGYSNDGTSAIDFVVARYLADGSLDPTFGGTGWARTDFGSTNGEVWDMAIQNDGKIIVAGYINPVSEDIALVRFVGDLPPTPEISVQRSGGVAVADGGSVSYGNGVVGASSSISFTISNPGTGNLLLSPITVDGANSSDFTVTVNPIATVAPGGLTSFTVRFIPGALGARSAAIHIPSNDLDENPYDIVLTGTGVPPPQKAQVTSPVNGSELSSTTLPLVWSTGVGVTSCYLFVGTTAGGYDLYAANQGTGTSQTVNVPADRRIYVTLWSLINGIYLSNHYVYAANYAYAVKAVKASLISPANGSTLTGNQLNLTWNTGTGVSSYYIFVGSAYGGYDLGAVSAGAANAWNLTVPQDGGPIYVTLWSLINGGYQAENYWFNAALPVSGSQQARITSPANTSTLGSATMNLTWDAGSGVTSYALWVGTTPNGYDLYSGLEGANLSRSVAIPGDGKRVHVTLHSLISGAYQSNSYYFTAPTLPDGGAAQVMSPVNGSTLADSNFPLAWSAASGATQYYLFVGSSPGASDLYAGSQGTTLNRTLSGMPVDGRAIYVTLYSWLNGAWKQSSAWFTTADTASGNRRALITSPVNGATLPSASTTFNWGGGVGVTSYALWIGSSAGAYDLWSSAETLATTSRTVTLPTDGRKLYVTLYSFIGGAWQGASYLYTASNVAVTKAALTSPVNGSAFTGASQTFTWSASNAATMYALWIGRTPGGYDIYSGAEGTNTTRTVNTLPTDGSPVYVTLYSLIKGPWQSNEYIYNAALSP